MRTRKGYGRKGGDCAEDGGVASKICVNLRLKKDPNLNARQPNRP